MLTFMVGLASAFSKLSMYALEGHFDQLPNRDMKVRKHVQDCLERFRDNMKSDFAACFNTRGKAFTLRSLDENNWEDIILQKEFFAEINNCIEDNNGLQLAGEVNPAALRSLVRILPIFPS